MPSRTGGEHGVAGQWRERRAVGIYKCHGRQCARNADRKPGGRCGCPLVVQASRGQWRTLPAGASLEEAKRALAKLRAERSARPAPQSAAPLTVGELAALYFESRLHLKPSTRRADAQLFLSHVAPAFGDLPLRQVRADDVRRWETGLRDEGVAHRSVSKSVWLLRRLLAWATDDERGWLDYSPLATYTPARARTPQGEGVQRVLNIGEIDEVLASAGSLEHRSLIRAALELLLRKGELLALQWDDFDLERRRVRVAWNLWRAQPRSGEVERQIVKGHQAQTLPLSPALAEELAVLRARHAGRAGASGFVWHGQGGPHLPIAESTPNTWLRAAITRANARREAAGVEGRIPHIVFHGLRHTGVTVLLEAGMPLARVSQFARHKDASITATLYAHLSQEGLVEIADYWEQHSARRESHLEALSVPQP
jgi:integrase